MEMIKFSGIDKKASVKKALSFFYDNLDGDINVELFLAKCRLQEDGKTVHYYPYLKVDIAKYREMKQNRKKTK